VFTRDELLAAVGGEPLGGALPPQFPGGTIDSRQVRPGELFVALRGLQTDGHRYIAAAARAGAAAVLCAHTDPEALALGVPQLVVDDPLATLQRLAGALLRRQPTTRVVSINGSNGKTSTKEAVAALLERLAPTLKTEGNLNTETGLPLTLLRLTPAHTFAVLEMGAQWVGEIALLCRIAPPSIALVTVVGPEHLEFFGSLAGVVEGESEAVAALDADGTAVLNADDQEVREMASRTVARVVTYGQRPDAHVRALDVHGDPLSGLQFALHHDGRNVPVALRVPGQHAITTALAAAAAALCCGMALEDIATGLAELRPVKRRGELKQGINGTILVDDTYNANRQSAEAALLLLTGARRPPGARRWFVFGDMLELGRYSLQEHAAVGATAAGAVDELVLVGADVSATAEAALRAGLPAERVRLFAAHLEDTIALAQARRAAATYVRDHARRGDIVMVKGSLGVGMDTVVQDLEEQATQSGTARHE
jgi:UDP-N-acetylmuramoyl-tripeptide--D-alanyl-D-alanine ligase